KNQLPQFWIVVGSKKRKPVPHVALAATPFVARVIGVSGKQVRSLTIGIVRGLAQKVTAVNRKLRIKPAIETYERLLLMKPAGAFDLIDFTDGRIRPDAAGIRIGNRPRYGGVDVASTDHVQNSNGISTDSYREVVRQLPFHLRPGYIDCGHPKIRRNPGDALLQRRCTGNGRYDSDAMRL